MDDDIEIELTTSDGTRLELTPEQLAVIKPSCGRSASWPTAFRRVSGSNFRSSAFRSNGGQARSPTRDTMKADDVDKTDDDLLTAIDRMRDVVFIAKDEAGRTGSVSDATYLAAQQAWQAMFREMTVLMIAGKAIDRTHHEGG